MKRIVRIVAPGVVVLAALAAPASARFPQQIVFTDNQFTPAKPPPKGVSQLGTEVAWIGPDAEQDHNIHQDARLFRSGPPNQVAEYQEDISAGRYHYYCQLHGSKAGGMDGVVKIRPTAVLADGDSIRIIWADSEAEANHRFRVEFRRVGQRKWKVWKRSTRQVQGEFGEGDEPINANPNRTYQLRVRTFVRKQLKRRSGWSPAVTLDVAP